MKRAFEIAKQSKCRQQHGAVVIRNGNVLAVATNKDRNLVNNLDESHVKEHASVHAEVAALSQVANPKGCTVFVARVMRDGKPGYSKPCSRCERYLKNAGVRRVVWT